MTYTDFVLSVKSSSFHQPNVDLLHAAMGLCTELGETLELESEEHEIEELGDIAWYLALGFHATGLDFENCTIYAPEEFYATVRGEDFLDTLIIYATELLDMVKKQVFYGREINTGKAHDCLIMLKNSMHHGLELSDGDITLDDIITANVKKLKARFPEKFTEDAANNRDVKEEYKQMLA